MRMVEVSLSIWGLCLASSMLRAVAQDCPAVPAGSFPDAAMLRAMSCVDPGTVTGAPVSAGRILLTGLANISSKGALLEKDEYETRVMAMNQSSTMTLGASTCSLVSMGFSKTSDTLVQMRLDYDKCSSGPTTASVMLNVVPVKDEFLSMGTSCSIFPFVKQVSTVQTTTLQPSAAKLSYVFSEVQVGLGTCAGSIMQDYSGMDKRKCKLACIALIQRFTASGESIVGNPEACLGYSVNEKITDGDNCHLYGKNVPVTNVTGTDKDYECYNLTAVAHETVEKQTTTDSPTEIAAAEASLPRLDLCVEAEAMSASVLTFKSLGDKCYTPFNVITLQDNTFNTLSTKMKESQWQDFLSMLPEPKARRLEDPPSAPVSEVLADRVAYQGSLALPAAAIPGVAAAPGAAVVAGAATSVASTTTPPCIKVPPATDPMPTILAIVMGIAVFPCGFVGYKAGHMGSGAAAYKRLQTNPH